MEKISIDSLDEKKSFINWTIKDYENLIEDFSISLAYVDEELKQKVMNKNNYHFKLHFTFKSDHHFNFNSEEFKNLFMMEE